jgi:hypothetical protein
LGHRVKELYRKLPICSPKWLYHFAFPSAM